MLTEGSSFLYVIHGKIIFKRFCFGCFPHCIEAFYRPGYSVTDSQPVQYFQFRQFLNLGVLAVGQLEVNLGELHFALFVIMYIAHW